MKVYTVTKQTDKFSITNDYNLTEHDSNTMTDPKTLLPIGRVILAKGLTYNEAVSMKNELDLAQGTHPIQEALKPEMAMDFKPNRKLFLPK